jgi:hypothetical protein
LVFGFKEQARKHADFSRDFRLLEADIVRKGERDYTEPDINNWQSRIRVLESTEPPALGVLVIACQNELAVAAGQPKKIKKIGLLYRLSKHFINWDTSHFGDQ